MGVCMCMTWEGDFFSKSGIGWRFWDLYKDHRISRWEDTTLYRYVRAMYDTGH